MTDDSQKFPIERGGRSNTSDDREAVPASGAIQTDLHPQVKDAQFRLKDPRTTDFRRMFLAEQTETSVQHT